MLQDTQPVPLDSEAGADAWAPFRVSQPQDMLALLRQLRDEQASVTLNGPGGASLSTTLWSVDEDPRTLSFKVHPEQPALAALIEADEGVAVAYTQHVKLQWDIGRLLLLRSPELALLRSALPDAVYRFQRRSAFRVRPPSRHAPVARLRHPAMPEMQLALRVLDLSLGGCALWCPADVPPLQAGTRLGEITIELDLATRLVSPALLAHVSSSAGEHGVRIGCEWQSLSPSAERVLQCWIDAAQRRRRLLALD